MRSKAIEQTERGRRQSSDFNVGMESLHFAVIMNLPLVVKALLEDVQEVPPFSKADTPRAPLILASERGYIELVQVLLAHKIGDLTTQNVDIETVLY